MCPFLLTMYSVRNSWTTSFRPISRCSYRVMRRTSLVAAPWSRRMWHCHLWYKRPIVPVQGEWHGSRCVRRKCDRTLDRQHGRRPWWAWWLTIFILVFNVIRQCVIQQRGVQPMLRRNPFMSTLLMVSFLHTWVWLWGVVCCFVFYSQYNRMAI